MTTEFLILLGGILVLYLGAEGLVRGSKRLAAALGIHPFIVGLTVVAFGTSMPELVFSVTAAYYGSPAMAIGNVVGSNIANMSIILGISALLSPMKVEDRTVRLEVPAIIFAGIGLFFFAGDMELTLVEGIILLFGFCCFFFLALFPQVAKGWKVIPENLDLKLENPVSEEEIAEARASQTWVTDMLMVALGIAGLVLGADFTVSSASEVAHLLGISELVIASSIVAFGTSLPELATSVVAAIKNEPDISVGNVIGSNLFNTLIVAGAPVIATGRFSIDPAVLVYDFPIMIGLSILILPLLRSDGKLDRQEALGLLLVYAGYILLIFVRPHFRFLPI